MHPQRKNIIFFFWIHSRPPYDIKNPYYAEVKVHRELMKGGDRHCMHIEIETENTPLTYAAGDHLGIFPKNPADEVERLAQRLGIADLDTVFSMTAIDCNGPVSSSFFHSLNVVICSIGAKEEPVPLPDHVPRCPHPLPRHLWHSSHSHHQGIQ